MELADVTDSKSVGSDTVWVRVPPSAPKKNDYSDRMVVLFCVCVRKDATSLRAKRVHHFSVAEHHSACGQKTMLLFEQTVLCSAQMMYCFAITMLHCVQIYAIIYHDVVKDERR